MKKLLFISKNLEIGGMEKALVILLNTLVKDYDITLILEEKKGILLKDLDSKINIEVYKLANSKNIIIRKFKNLVHKTFWKLKNKNKYDFSCNYATYSLIGAYLAKVASPNNSLYVHSNYYEAYKHNVEKFCTFFNQLKIEDFKHIIFVSNEAKDSFNNIYPNLKSKTWVINNLVDYKNIKRLSTQEVEVKFNKNKTNFLFVGRLDNDSKNFVRMLKSFSLAISKNKNLCLYIIGEGKDNKLIKDLIKKYHLEKHVFLLGAINNPYQYFKSCDAFLLTSNYEGFPVVLIEALVLNVPMISTIDVSDEEINLKDYINKLPFLEKDIADILINFKKEKVDYKLDFKKINEKRILKLKKIINTK